MGAAVDKLAYDILCRADIRDVVPNIDDPGDVAQVVALIGGD